MTRWLVLYRHAKSDWSNRACPDRERPLNERGQADRLRMAEALAPRLAELQAVACSPSLRTRLTLAPLIDRLPDVPVAYADALYEAPPSVLDAWLRTDAPAVERLLVVGHEYGLSQWARQLCPTLDADKIPTAGCLALELHGPTWADAREARVLWFLSPKTLSGRLN